MNGAAFHINFGAGIDALKQPFKSADHRKITGRIVRHPLIFI